MRILIVDDEAPARSLLRAHLKDRNDLQIIGECENGFEALRFIQDEKPDLVLLDIQMPKINGLELLEVLDDAPAVVFITAYAEYAVRAFEANAVDYVLKPVDKSRLLVAIDKAIANLNKTKVPTENLTIASKAPDEKLSRIVVKDGKKITVIPVEEIDFIEALDDYVRIHAAKGKYVKKQTMKYLETALSDLDFVRVHRSYIVKISQIARLELLEKENHILILKNGEKIKVSASGYPQLKAKLGI